LKHKVNNRRLLIFNSFDLLLCLKIIEGREIGGVGRVFFIKKGNVLSGYQFHMPPSMLSVLQMAVSLQNGYLKRFAVMLSKK
jgi:hypothetical protein